MKLKAMEAELAKKKKEAIDRSMHSAKNQNQLKVSPRLLRKKYIALIQR